MCLEGRGGEGRGGEGREGGREGREGKEGEGRSSTVAAIYFSEFIANMHIHVH